MIPNGTPRHNFRAHDPFARAQPTITEGSSGEEEDACGSVLGCLPCLRWRQHRLRRVEGNENLASETVRVPNPPLANNQPITNQPISLPDVIPSMPSPRPNSRPSLLQTYTPVVENYSPGPSLSPPPQLSPRLNESLGRGAQESPREEQTQAHQHEQRQQEHQVDPELRELGARVYRLHESMARQREQWEAQERQRREQSEAQERQRREQSESRRRQRQLEETQAQQRRDERNRMLEEAYQHINSPAERTRRQRERQRREQSENRRQPEQTQAQQRRDEWNYTDPDRVCIRREGEGIDAWNLRMLDLLERSAPTNERNRMLDVFFRNINSPAERTRRQRERQRR